MITIKVLSPEIWYIYYEIIIRIYYLEILPMIPVDLLLERGASYREIYTGDMIFTKGAPVCFYYQLVSGRIRWCNNNVDGHEVLHKIVSPGDCFGILSLFDQEVYETNAIADSPGTLIRLSISKFYEILHEFPEIHMKFTKALISQLRFKFMLTNLLSTHSPEEVIESLLRYLNKEGIVVCQECNKLMLTRQQLANMTGLRVETVIRTIRQMEKDKKISIVRGKVFIPDNNQAPSEAR